MRNSFKKTIVSAISSTPLPATLVRLRARNMLTILTYHRILPARSDFPFDDGVISVTPEEFEREVDYLRRHLDVISMRDLVQAMTDHTPLPLRPALITFDDGYKDNYDYAFPILKQFGLSGTFFLTTQFVGTSVVPWWDQVACCMKFSKTETFPSPFSDDDPPYQLDQSNCIASIRRFLSNIKKVPWSQVEHLLDVLRDHSGVEPKAYLTDPLFMSWSEAYSLTKGGMELGGHTRTHPILGQVFDGELLRAEITGCHKDMSSFIGYRPSVFAYPVGNLAAMSRQADEEIKLAGFQLSFSFIHSMAHVSPSARWRIPRLAMDHGDSYEAFRMSLSRCPQLSSASLFQQ